jgi:hypothetical protein
LLKLIVVFSEEVAGAAVGETMATVTPETMAEFSSAFEQIMGDTAVDDLSGYTVETFGRSARATHNNGSSSNWVIVRPVPNILDWVGVY